MKRTPVGIGVIVVLAGWLGSPLAGDAGPAGGAAPMSTAVLDVSLMSGSTPGAAVPRRPQDTVTDLWAAGTATFGVFVPNERPRPPRGQGRGQRQAPLYTVEGGRKLAQNPLYDFVFLNLEGGYDTASVAAIVEGLRTPEAAGRKALLVRIPPIERDGAAVTRGRVEEILAAGADGVVFPHVRSPAEAALAVSLMTDAGADLWSPSNPSGDKIAMIMIEDPDSLALAAEIAEVPGISVLACGIGSLRGALGGDREAAEAGNQEVLAHAKRVGVADMLTANTADVEQRVQEGFLALLMQGAEADEAIRIGRAAAGR